MRSQTISERQPLVYNKIVSEVRKKNPTMSYKFFYNILHKRVPISEEELQNRIDSAIEEIYYPLFDVCEDILAGLVDSNIKIVGGGSFKLEVGGITLSVCEAPEMVTGLRISPDITETWCEYKLLADCVNVFIHTEIDGRARSQMIKHYDERGCDFE